MWCTTCLIGSRLKLSIFTGFAEAVVDGACIDPNMGTRYAGRMFDAFRLTGLALVVFCWACTATGAVGLVLVRACRADTTANIAAGVTAECLVGSWLAFCMGHAARLVCLILVRACRACIATGLVCFGLVAASRADTATGTIGLVLIGACRTGITTVLVCFGLIASCRTGTAYNVTDIGTYHSDVLAGIADSVNVASGLIGLVLILVRAASNAVNWIRSVSKLLRKGGDGTFCM